MAPSLAEALAGLAAPTQSTTAMLPFDGYIAGQLGLASAEVYSMRVNNIGRLRKQIQQSDRSTHCPIAVAVFREEELVDKTRAQASKILGQDHKDALVAVVVPEGGDEPSRWVVFEPEDGTVAGRLGQEHHVDREVVVPEAPAPVASSASTPPSTLAVPVPVVEAPLVVDPRIRRMLRLAIASSKAVMLVGPPGTGKTTLLAEAMAEARLDPSSYGLDAPPGESLQVTPEEGWTTRELVGGETVDDEGRLRFRPGHVLDAIARNRWLILDEANRADMDRIFGGLLTFLSGKRVSLTRASGALDSAEVLLGWGEDSECSVDGGERLEEGTGADITFLAGCDWRLLGTYNALDAHRVFRFGQALGRRFARVPVPAITVSEFRAALLPQLVTLETLTSESDRQRIEAVLCGLYAAHLETPPLVGPALFLAVPRYVASGLQLPSGADGEETGDEDLDRLLTEGYLLGAGPLLAQLDPAARDRFHRRVVTDEQLISETQWDFLTSLLPALT